MKTLRNETTIQQWVQLALMDKMPEILIRKYIALFDQGKAIPIITVDGECDIKFVEET